VIAYVDASALVKLVVQETESGAIRTYLGGHETVASSRVAIVEVRRAAARHPLPASAPLDAVLDAVVVVELDEGICAAASDLKPVTLRTLDAIHLASALELGEDLAAFVAYDTRLVEAARQLGLPVVSPA